MNPDPRALKSCRRLFDMYLDDCTLSVVDCRFENNHAVGSGGALFAGTGTTLFAINGLFEDNSADAFDVDFIRGFRSFGLSL